MLAQNVVLRGFSVLTQLILAALLSPADFGMIGLANILTNTAYPLTNIGIEDILLRRRTTLGLWLGSAFWISFLLSGLVGIVIILISPLMASMYGTPDLVGLIVVAGIALPIAGLSFVPTMVLRSRMNFSLLAASGAAETISVSLFSILLAWLGAGAYSFVIPLPVIGAVKALVLWRLTLRRPSLRLRPGRWKYLFRDVSYNFFNRFLISLVSQGDYFVLGLLATPKAVGIYFFGYRLAAQPLTLLAGNLTGVLYPAVVQLNFDPRRQVEVVMSASMLLFFCIAPAGLLQAVTAGPLITAFFGQKWAASIPVIQLLSIGLAMDSVGWTAFVLMNARGQFRAGFIYMIIETPIFFVLVTCGALLNQEVGVAWAVLVFYSTKPTFTFIVFRRAGVPFGRIAMIYLKPASLAILGIGGSWLLFEYGTPDWPPLVRAALICICGLASYAGLARAFTPEIWEELQKRLLAATRRISKA